MAAYRQPGVAGSLLYCYLPQQVRDGVVSPIDAEVVSRLIDKYISATKWTDIEKELHELQARINGKAIGNSVGCPLRFK